MSKLSQDGELWRNLYLHPVDMVKYQAVKSRKNKDFSHVSLRKYVLCKIITKYRLQEFHSSNWISSFALKISELNRKQQDDTSKLISC